MACMMKCAMSKMLCFWENPYRDDQLVGLSSTNPRVGESTPDVEDLSLDKTLNYAKIKW